VSLGEHVMSVSASVGVAFDQDTLASPEDLLRAADLAMYEAKGRGGGRSHHFVHNMHLAAVERMQLEVDLRQGLERNEVQVEYQPIVNLLTGEIVGVEALARWQHPTLGILSPGRFIELAEEIDLIIPLGAQVLRAACMQMRRWVQDGLVDDGFAMSINLSSRQLLDPNFDDLVRETLEETGLTSEHLWLEVTESSLLTESALAEPCLDRLRQLGVKLGLDDFGVGYSALSYLRDHTFDVLKVDRSFTMCVLTPRSQAILTTMLHLANALGMKVVVEGVEDESQLFALRRLGVTTAQGFYFAPGLPAETLTSLLRERTSLLVQGPSVQGASFQRSTPRRSTSSGSGTA